VILPPGYEHPEINDSKKLSPRQRERLYGVIERDAVSIGVGIAEAPVIDAVNILQATLTAMKEAVLELSPSPDYLLIDGLNRIDLAIPQETIIRGDSRSISVASASIVAKVLRDRLMEMYHRQFPQYNFLRNKGYGTREHREAILKFGRSKIHRRSFRVAEIDGPPAMEKLDI
jgi:ribonuclease HII